MSDLIVFKMLSLWYKENLGICTLKNVLSLAATCSQLFTLIAPEVSFVFRKMT